MGFLNPRKDDDEDEALPGATGLHLDLDLKRCPDCRRELTPWQERCPDCDAVGVPASALRAPTFTLPDLPSDDDLEDGAATEDGATTEDGSGGPGQPPT